MFDVWESSAALRQPCLTRQLPARLVTTDGRVEPRVLTSLDRLLLEHLQAGAAALPQAAETQMLPPPDRWINTSALQKAIRRGDVFTAVRTAQSGCSLDPDHTFRRLAVCALEDVGIGNLLAVGMALAACGSSRTRKAPDAARVAAFLATELARSVKSRLACDLLSIVDYNRRMDGEKHRLLMAPADQLSALGSDVSRSPAQRMVAVWTLAGASRFRGVTMPMGTARPRTHLMRLMAESRMPLILYYIADRSAARLSDAMFASVLLIWQSLRESPSTEVVGERPPNSDVICGLPAVAFDAHTRAGRAALSRFAVECHPISKCLAGLSSAQKRSAISHAVFIAEGGCLDRQVTYPLDAAVRSDAHYHELAFAGLQSRTQQEALLGAIRENTSMLNTLRTEAAKRSGPDL